MPPISTATWVRKSTDRQYSLNSDGNSNSSSNYSCGEGTKQPGIPSFMLNDDDQQCRSYVDPWDMENYSFLRRQLEGISLQDEVSSTPALESATHSDFYYVPLDHDGSPQFQYKHYVDNYQEGTRPPVVFREDNFVNSLCGIGGFSSLGGMVAGVDEHDFYNEYLETPHPSLHSGSESYLEFSNPSRQSERSRYNNQDYQTYTPPSIVKESPPLLISNYNYSLQRDRRLSNLENEERVRASLNYVNQDMESEDLLRAIDDEIRRNRRKSLPVVSRKMSERSNLVDKEREKENRRKSVFDNPGNKEKIDRRRSVHEELPRFTKHPKSPRKSILQAREMSNSLPKPRTPSVTDSSLVYVYETAKRRRRMVLPNPSPETGTYQNQQFRRNGSKMEDGFSPEPMAKPEVGPIGPHFRPMSRYAMTTYGHLKIDYSCSWNCLDKYITHRARS